MALIAVTRLRDDEGSIISINPAFIVSVEDRGDFRKISTLDGHTFLVKDKIHDVLDAIDRETCRSALGSLS